jgi:hypothetical protein
MTKNVAHPIFVKISMSLFLWKKNLKIGATSATFKKLPKVYKHGTHNRQKFAQSCHPEKELDFKQRLIFFTG